MITTTIRIEKNANKGIPSTYTPATLPTLTNTIADKNSVEIPAVNIEDANIATALTNLETELNDWLNATFYDNTLHLDANDTFSVNVTVSKIVRTRQQSNDLKPGADYIKIYFSYEYN